MSAGRGSRRTGIGTPGAMAPVAGLGVAFVGCATMLYGGPAQGAPTMQLPRPTIEVHLDAGSASGGDDGAGDGYLMGGGVNVTPLWIDNVGLGAGLDVLFKYASTSTGALQSSRSSMPTLLTGHVLIGLDEGARWYLLARAGLEMDLNRQSSSNGMTSNESSRGAGILAEIGPIFAVADHFAVGATVRATLIDLPAGMDHVSGSNVGILLSAYFNYAGERKGSHAP